MPIISNSKSELIIDISLKLNQLISNESTKRSGYYLRQNLYEVHGGIPHEILPRFHANL